jgi:hypothetical protein
LTLFSFFVLIFQASETHKELCLPAEKPEGCNENSWNSLKSVFEGELCREGRDDHVNFPQVPAAPGQAPDVVHRPGETGEILNELG